MAASTTHTSPPCGSTVSAATWPTTATTIRSGRKSPTSSGDAGQRGRLRYNSRGRIELERRDAGLQVLGLGRGYGFKVVRNGPPDHDIGLAHIPCVSRPRDAIRSTA